MDKEQYLPIAGYSYEQGFDAGLDEGRREAREDQLQSFAEFISEGMFSRREIPADDDSCRELAKSVWRMAKAMAATKPCDNN